MDPVCSLCKFPIRAQGVHLEVLGFFKKCTFDMVSVLYDDYDYSGDIIKEQNEPIPQYTTQTIPLDVMNNICTKSDLKTRAKFKLLCRDYRQLDIDIPTIHEGVFAWTRSACVGFHEPVQLFDVRVSNWNEFTINKEKYEKDLEFLKKEFSINDDNDYDKKWLHINTDNIMHTCCAKMHMNPSYKIWKKTLSKYLPNERGESFNYMKMIFKIIGIKVSKQSNKIQDENGKVLNSGKYASLPTLNFLQESRYTPAFLQGRLQEIKQFYSFETDDTKLWIKELKDMNIATLLKKHPELEEDYDYANDCIYDDLVFLSDLPVFNFLKSFQITDEKCELLQYLFKGPPKE